MKEKPKKKWGQNFLRNTRAVKRIVEALAPQPGDLVIEIGPGEGALTHELAGLPNPVVAMEIDPALVERLRGTLGIHVSVIHADATEVAFPEQTFYAVGNLPYNVATPIIRRVITSANWRRAVFMVQKEVADRFTARVGDEAYGYLTLLTQLYATTRRLMTLEPGSFHPPPKVRSAVVVFEPMQRQTRAPRQRIAELLSISFRMRRKKLLNNLEGFDSLTRPQIQRILEDAGIAPSARAEEMSLEDFDRLAVAIERDGVASDDRP